MGSLFSLSRISKLHIFARAEASICVEKLTRCPVFALILLPGSVTVLGKKGPAELYGNDEFCPKDATSETRPGAKLEVESGWEGCDP